MRRRFRTALVLLAAPLSLTGCAVSDDAPKAGAVPEDAVGTLFVANKRGDTLSQIDLADGQERFLVSACADPHELAMSPDGRHVALACYGGSQIIVYETARSTVAVRIALGENARPHGIVWHANGSIYATAEGRDAIYRIDNPLLAQIVVREFSTGQKGSHMLAVSSDGRNAWTADLGAGTITLLDLTGSAAPRSVAIGKEPEGIALTPDDGALWVSARGEDRAYELDPRTLAVRRSVATGAFPLRLAIRPQGDVAITSNLADGSLSVIDLSSATILRTIAVSSPAEAKRRQQVTVLWSSGGDTIYVAETGTNTVAQIDYGSGRLVRRIAAGDGGDGLAVKGPTDG